MRYLSTIVVICSMLLNYPWCVGLNEKKEIKENQLYAISAVLMDGDTGRILYEKNGSEVRAMASTTKIMTLILTLEYGNTDDIVTVSSYAAKMPDVQLGIKKGEQYRLKDLLYSLMLESHNDSAVAIAEHVGGDVEGFAAMMNKKAAELGLKNTYFITPNGLDATDDKGKHSTTAADLALLMKYCTMESPKKDEFISICQTMQYSFTEYDGTRSFSVTNRNSFLTMMDGLIAGKTGFTTEAGYCYVAALERDQKTYIIALLGCGWPNNKTYKWSDSKKLFNYGIDNYDYEMILDNSFASPNIRVKDGIEKSYISTYVSDNISMIMCDEDNVRLESEIPEVITAPISKDAIVGKLNVYINDELFTSCNIYSSESVKKTSYLYYLKTVVDCYIF
ncbi:MAG: D-alanyl-D-alanine carboxypeptidase [Lachnospiraceae bacterium]|nr:D-alanyl-D-alanine carboxypeptidase [Lachnospiraceae bacterium]